MITQPTSWLLGKHWCQGQGSNSLVKEDCFRSTLPGKGYFLISTLTLTLPNAILIIQKITISVIFNFLEDRLFISSDRNTNYMIPSAKFFSNRYMRLGADNGHLKVYNLFWHEVEDFFAGFIDSWAFPTVCGNYGICTNGQCSCPRPIKATSYFQPIEETQPDHGCSLITPLSCAASKTHILLELHKITYFLFTQDPPSIDPDHQHISLDSCKQALLKDCSCKAGFYNSSKRVGNCYLLPQIFFINGHWSSSEPPQQQTNHKKKNQIIVG